MRVNAGADFQAGVMSSTSSNGTGTYAAANYMALSTDSTAPAATDTTLAGELSNVGGGLNRAQAVYAHTAGTSSYTLSKSFTANSNDGTSNTVSKIGIFNASSGGTLFLETALSIGATLGPGDLLTITETVNF